MMRAHQMMNLNAPPSPEELIAAQAQAQAAAHPRSFGTRLPTSAAPPELQYDKKALEESSPPVSFLTARSRDGLQFVFLF